MSGITEGHRLLIGELMKEQATEKRDILINNIKGGFYIENEIMINSIVPSPDSETLALRLDAEEYGHLAKRARAGDFSG